MSHPKAVLTPIGRLILVRRMAQGRPAAHLASEMGISRATAYKWWRRYVHEGEAGLRDRSSRPLHSPRRTPARVERQIEALRRRTKLGPVRIAVRLQMPASTVHRVLVRQKCRRGNGGERGMRADGLRAATHARRGDRRQRRFAAAPSQGTNSRPLAWIVVTAGVT